MGQWVNREGSGQDLGQGREMRWLVMAGTSRARTSPVSRALAQPKNPDMLLPARRLQSHNVRSINK
jgi:hypothetical protein